MTGPRTLTGKIIAEHLAGESEEEIELRVDQILLEDATGTMACLQFEELGLDRVALPTVSYVDHNVLQFDNKNPEDHAYLRSWAARYGALYSRPGNGIAHYLHLERFSRPGQVLLGADSHTTMAGALGMLAIGAGATEVAVAMAGRPYPVERPLVTGVELRGRLRPWVQSKDVVLELLRRHGVRGGRGRIFEFHGDGVSTLSATDRGTICNMVMETGATTGIFPSDEQTRAWLAAQGRQDEWVELAEDDGAEYDETEVIELGELEPLIALPTSPGNVVPVREAAGTATRQVCVGSSVNSSYEDLALVAAVLHGRTLPADLDLTVTPGSRQILDMIVRSGVYADLLASGARILEPACGPCIGMGQAPAAGAVSVRTFNRNFPGRSGTPGDQVYLCSPATAAATALRGEIADPRGLGDVPELTPPPPNPEVDDRQIVSPPEDGRGIELEKGGNIVPPPPVPMLAVQIEGRVLIVVPDDVSTGDMAPDGALGLAIWSNIPACARYMFRRFDPDFPARAEEWGGGIVVGGHNYGQGSSREQAAFAALHLGVRAIVAKSFARIHRTNLIAQGILPLTFADEADYDSVELGDEWTIREVRSTVESGGTALQGPVPLEARLTAREREILLAGGLIAYASELTYAAALNRVVVGGARPLSGPIEIHDYDPEWPARYDREEARIHSILGDRVVRIEHVGSTSVPGLAAKPIIDIVLEVPDSADEPAYVPDLEAAGYVLRIRESEWFEHRLLRGPDTGVSVHVFSAGCAETDRMILFRDRLRANEDDRRLYEAKKRELAARHWKYVQQYADAKTDVVQAIIARALAPEPRSG